MPRVTIICATYNWSSVLPYSIGSVLRQTFADWEMLVVGDHCTDDSEQVVNRMRAQPGGDRVRWINLPVNNGQQFGPNNEGLRQAEGDLIAYLGHDDLWLPHHLSCLIAAVDAGADVAHSVVEWVYPGNEIRCPFPPQWIMAPSSVLHRRGVTERVGGWRDYRQIVKTPDADLWERAQTSGFRFRFAPRLTVVKFPAIARRDVYKLRPCHEQAAWFDRIGREPDFEPVEMAAMLIAYSEFCPQLGLRTLAGLTRRLVERKLQTLHAKLSGSRKGWRIEAWRKFKGLP